MSGFYIINRFQQWYTCVYIYIIATHYFVVQVANTCCL